MEVMDGVPAVEAMVAEATALAAGCLGAGARRSADLVGVAVRPADTWFARASARIFGPIF